MKPPRPSISFSNYRSGADATRTVLEARPWFLDDEQDDEANTVVSEGKGTKSEPAPAPARPALTPRLALPRNAPPNSQVFTGTVPLPFQHDKARTSTPETFLAKEAKALAFTQTPAHADASSPAPRSDKAAWRLPDLPDKVVVGTREEHPSFGPVSLSYDSRPSITFPSVRRREAGLRRKVLAVAGGLAAAVLGIGLGALTATKSESIAPAISVAAAPPVVTVVELDAPPSAAKLTPEQLFQPEPSTTPSASTRITERAPVKLQHEKKVIASDLAARRAPATPPVVRGQSPTADELIRAQRLRGERE